MSIEFSVLRFTPDPEEVEPVNVALLMWDRPPRLIFDDSFPRLRCVAPEADVSLLRFYLDDLSGHLGNLSERDAGRAMSAQFQVSEPRRLLGPASEDFIRILKERYLRTARSKHSATRPRRRIENRLEQLLVRRLHVSSDQLLRRATPREFLAPETYQKLGGNGIVVTRAIRGPRDLVLIDGVNLNLALSKVELRGQHIAAAFFKIGQLRSDLAKIERRDLTRTTVLFGEVAADAEHHRARWEFLGDMLRRESDLVEKADALSAEFRQAISRAAPRLAD